MMNDQIEQVANWIAASKHLVVFTGAGISTGSGLPDFRGPNGVWTRRDAGLPPPKSKNLTEVQPNVAHLALRSLQRMGLLKFLISQNVDNLHLRSGIGPEQLAELHGNGQLMRCTGCDRQFPLADVGWDRVRYGLGYRTQKPRAGQPDCPICESRLVSSVVNFGDSMPAKELEASYEHAEASDVFFVIGSSLLVSPANDLPKVAVDHGAKLIILNRGETPLDGIAGLCIDGDIGEALPAITASVERLFE